jgi:Tol biopolymer transport system component
MQAMVSALTAFVAFALPPLAFVRDGGIWLCDEDGGNARRVVAHGRRPQWSPDHRKLAFSRGGAIYVYGLDTHRTRKVVPASERRFTDEGSIPAFFAWSPDGRFLTYTRWRTYGKGNFTLDGSEIVHLPLAGGKVEAPSFGIDDSSTGAHFSENENPAWSRSGRLAFVRNGDVWLASPYREPGVRPGHDLTRIAASAQYDGPNYRASRENHFARRLSWSPDGRRLAYDVKRIGGTGTYELYLLEIGAKPDSPWPTVRSIRLDDNAYDPTFSPDGKRIAYANPDDGAIWTMDLTGKGRRRLIANASEPAW